MLVCFDIDGTLADLSHRVHYLRENGVFVADVYQGTEDF